LLRRSPGTAGWPGLAGFLKLNAKTSELGCEGQLEPADVAVAARVSASAEGFAGSEAFL